MNLRDILSWIIFSFPLKSQTYLKNFNTCYLSNAAIASQSSAWQSSSKALELHPWAWPKALGACNPVAGRPARGGGCRLAAWMACRNPIEQDRILQCRCRATAGRFGRSCIRSSRMAGSVLQYQCCAAVEPMARTSPGSSFVLIAHLCCTTSLYSLNIQISVVYR